MVSRLRLGASRLREAERRVASGDLARQVNHDVKNGLVPIRNVLRHLDEVARDDPSTLVERYRERRGTLESSVAYLETLARNYARISPAPSGSRATSTPWWSSWWVATTRAAASPPRSAPAFGR